MSKVGSSVAPCRDAGAALDDSEGKPVDPARHKNCAVKILSIKEKENEAGGDYLGGGIELFVKGLAKELVIQYEVKGCETAVTLWIEFDAGNRVHADFYKTYEDNGVTKPRVVVVTSGATKGPGVHEALWDCRDQTPDHRILLDGTYKVRIQGLHDAVATDTNTIRIMPPLAWNFGIHYPGNTTKKEVEHAAKIQGKLSDGTGFTANSSSAELATVAWNELRDSAVGTISGHSNPLLLAFYPEESQPGKPVKFNRVKQSFILTRARPNPMPAKPKADAANSVFLPEEPANALRDVLFVVLAGCRAGNEVLLVQHRLKELSKQFHPGPVDGVHGRKTTAALKSWQQWEKIEPADGTKNEATLAKLGVDAGLSEKEQTRDVQKKLVAFSKRYNPGKEDGLWGDDTEAAITHYQEDHPPLELTSLPDKETVQHLRPEGTLGGQARDMAEAFTMLGCNIVCAFTTKVSFPGCEKWHINLWDALKTGTGIDDAALQARDLSGVKYRKELDYIIYTRDGLDKNTSLTPARYGKDM